MSAVETRDLRKSYGSCQVLHGLDLRVSRGTLYGFLGPNGAGKSTTLRILLGLLRRNGGDARVLGCDPWQDGARIRADIGYLPGDVRWYPRLTGRATLRFLANARRRDCRQRIPELAERFDLDLDQGVRTYSRGMKQKLGLIQALMHEPELLILDEPTSGLDPLMQNVLHAELRRTVAAGHTVLFSSHTLSEVEQLCDHVGIVRDGRLIEQTTLELLRSRAVRRVEIEFAGAAPAADLLPLGWHGVLREPGRLTGSWTGDLQELLNWLSRQSVRDVVIAPANLEDLFRAYYTASAPEAVA